MKNSKLERKTVQSVPDRQKFSEFKGGDASNLRKRRRKGRSCEGG